MAVSPTIAEIRAFSQGLPEREVLNKLRVDDPILTEGQRKTGRKDLDDRLWTWRQRHLMVTWIAAAYVPLVALGVVLFLNRNRFELLGLPGFIWAAAIWWLLTGISIGANTWLEWWWQNSISRLTNLVDQETSAKEWNRSLVAILRFIRANPLMLQTLHVFNWGGNKAIDTWVDLITGWIEKTQNAHAPEKPLGEQIGQVAQLSQAVQSIEVEFTPHLRNRCDWWIQALTAPFCIIAALTSFGDLVPIFFRALF